MREQLRDVVSVVRAIGLTAKESQLTFLAAAVAYYAFVSLVPLLALALVVSSAIGGEWVIDAVIARFEDVLTPQVEEMLREALAGGTGRVGASVVGTLVVLWSALKVLRALDTAFSAIYAREHLPSLLQSVLNGAVVLAVVPLGVGIAAATPIAVRLFPLGPFTRTATLVLGIFAMAVVFLPMYVVFPGRSVSLKHAAPGALFAAIGWTLLGAAFSVYVSVAGGMSIYGPLGGFLLLVTVLYFGAAVLLTGAVVNAVLGGDRQLQQGGESDDGQSPIMGSDGTDEDEETSADAREAGSLFEGDAAQATAPDSDAPTADGEDATEDKSGDDRSGGGVTDGDEAADGGSGGDGSDRSESGVGDDAAEFDPDARRDGSGEPPGPADSPTARRERERLQREVAELRDELEGFQTDVEDRTVDRDAVEADLRRYVRRRMRRGHARGWGPYLVLLYGTVMTLGAFYLLGGGYAVLAMIVIWLSTLGLYTLMLLVGFGLHLVGAPGRLRERVSDWRS